MSKNPKRSLRARLRPCRRFHAEEHDPPLPGRGGRRAAAATRRLQPPAHVASVSVAGTVPSPTAPRQPDTLQVRPALAARDLDVRLDARDVQLRRLERVDEGDARQVGACRCRE